jgi:ABC-type sugar transport system permease subunit
MSAQVQSPLTRRPFAWPSLGASRSKGLNSQLLWGLGCAAPALLGFGLWKVVPVAASFIVALTDWNVAHSPRWVGLENFRRMLFHDPLFWK